MKLFGKEPVNTGRQFEFDFAKAVCILGMVIVHCFEALSADSVAESGAYYAFDTVLDALFGAGTFMVCMGLGIAYSWKGDARKLTGRGLSIFLLGYLLNFLRDGIPDLIRMAAGIDTLDTFLLDISITDILPFAGLALMLFGFLKKHGVSDLGLFVIALAMSVAGSFIRCLDIGHYLLDNLAGLIFGTFDPIDEFAVATFPLLNWFIIVVAGYEYGQLLMRCTDVEKYYRISFPVSGALLAVYMLLAIPNRVGMMSGEIIYFYQMTTPEAFMMLTAAVFVTGMYHFVSKPLTDKIKNVVTEMSSNINEVYIIHWLIIGWFSLVLDLAGSGGLDTPALVIAAAAIFIAANVIAAAVKRRRQKPSAE